MAKVEFTPEDAPSPARRLKESQRFLAVLAAMVERTGWTEEEAETYGAGSVAAELLLSVMREVDVAYGQGSGESAVVQALEYYRFLGAISADFYEQAVLDEIESDMIDPE